MQYLLSGYANGFNRRHNRGEHLFQGRFKGELIEDESYLFDVDQAAFAQPRSAVLARDIAAWMARRLTCATLRELAAPFGLTHPDRVANLTRRAERAMQQRPRLRRQVESPRKTLLGAHQPT